MHQSSRSLLRRAIAGIAPLILIPLVAAPAVAAELTVEDAVGDMWKVDNFSDDFVPAPNARNGDFIRTKFNHTATRVIMKSEFVELRAPRRDQLLDFEARMRDENGKKHIISVVQGDGFSDAQLSTYRGSSVRCNVSYKVDYDANMVRTSFPRRCIDNPESLQFTAVNVWYRGNAMYFDNPHNPTADYSVWTAKVPSD